MKRIMLCLLALLLAVLAGCAPAPAPETVPSQEPISPEADASRAERMEAPLYFRMRGEDLLARETRTLWVPDDRLPELVLIQALIAGPGASLLDLSGVFVPGTKVISVRGAGDVLTVTVSSAFLDTPDDIRQGWETDAALRREVLLRRRLALLSIVCSITEATEYASVQLLVQTEPDDAYGRRIARAEIYEDETDASVLLGPVSRAEDVLLTHYNAAGAILNAWRAKDFDRLYRFVAQEEGKPTRTAFIEEMSALGRSLTAYSLTSGSVGADGKTAVLLLNGNLSDSGGASVVGNYPLRLVLENGQWRIRYAALVRLMEAAR